MADDKENKSREDSKEGNLKQGSQNEPQDALNKAGQAAVLAAQAAKQAAMTAATVTKERGVTALQYGKEKLEQLTAAYDNGNQEDNSKRPNEQILKPKADIEKQVEDFAASSNETNEPTQGSSNSKENQHDEVDLTPEEQLTRHHVNLDIKPPSHGPMHHLKESAGRIAHNAKDAAEHVPTMGGPPTVSSRAAGGDGERKEKKDDEDSMTHAMHDALKDYERDRTSAYQAKRLGAEVSDFPETLEDAVKTGTKASDTDNGGEIDADAEGEDTGEPAIITQAPAGTETSTPFPNPLISSEEAQQSMTARSRL